MRIRLFVSAVVAAALLVAALLLPRTPGPNWGLVLVFGALIFAAEWASLTTPYGATVSVAFSLLFSVLVLGGPATAALAALFTAVTPRDIAERKPLHRIIFNAAQYPLMVLCGGLVMYVADIPPLLSSPQTLADFSIWVVPATLAAAVIAGTNWLLVGLAVSISLGVSLREVWRQEFRLHLVSFTALTLLGFVLIMLAGVAGALSTLLLAVPFFVARQTFRVSADLASALRETTRGLVAVLEAKDPYTRGHSERVAVYARDIAEELNLSPAAVQTIELAALLHDVGKVGIAAATLRKPDRLTTDEFSEIQLHPITGSSILSDILFMKDVVPLIEAHHERMDGSGYPYGLGAAGIPVGARILAVADSFDAMTSDRAYRRALTYDFAVAELRKGSARRLDADCVAALLGRVSQDRVAQLLIASTPEGVQE